MKTVLFALILPLLAIVSFTRTPEYKLPERQIPIAKQEQLSRANTINDISPLLWSNLYIAHWERYDLHRRLTGVSPQPENYKFPNESYTNILQPLFVEITTSHNGKTKKVTSIGEQLTPDQKTMLATADLGSDIHVTISFKYKDQTNDQFGKRNEVLTGGATFNVLPETAATFPGGHKELNDYIVSNVISKVTTTKAVEKVQEAMVKLTVDPDGQVTNATLTRSSKDAQIDRLLLDAFENMPKWKPAQNSKGEKIKQDVIIPLGFEGC